MKKIIMLCMGLLVSAAMGTAQAAADGTFQFCDKDGNVIADGATVTRDKVEKEENPDYDPKDPEDIKYFKYQIPTGLWIKNTNASNETCKVKYNIKQMDHGGFQICVAGQCRNVDAVGEYETGSMDIAGNALENLDSEWSPNSEKDGKCVIEFQIESSHGVGPKVTVNYVHTKGGSTKGDFNGNGKIDVDDVKVLIQAIVDGKTATEHDIDGNGVVNVSDVTKLINTILAAQ